MIRQPLYWSGPEGLGLQKIVEPGSYWRRVLNVPIIDSREQAGVGRIAEANSQTPAILLEVVLEWVRAMEFGSHPSRATCHFAWENEAWARTYHQTLPRATLYEIEPVGNPRLVRSDFTLGNAFREGDSLTSMVERARRYWRGEIEGQVEVLIPGPLTIVRAIV
jgi:hypothetical protein